MEIKITNQGLNYLFEAAYKDGKSYLQGSDDLSLFVEGKNAFFDIFYQPHKPLEDLISFKLIGNGNEILVDLTDGHFEINGARVQIGDDLPAPFDYPLKYELIYFKRHRHHHTTGGETIDRGDSVRYFVGWKTTIAGKSHQRVVCVNNEH